MVRVATSLVLLLMAGAVTAHAQSLSVELDANESPPYWSASMPNDGLCGEIVHALSAAAGVSSHINYKPLSRMIEDDDNNDLGNPDFYMLNQDFAAIIPICLYQASIYYYAPRHKGKISFQRLEDLKGYRIGILSGALVDRTYFEKAGVVFEESYSRESLFKKLKLGRIDLCLVVDLVGYQIISRLFPEHHDDFVAIHLENSTAPLAILLAKDYPQAGAIANKYRQGLNSIIQNGTYQEILTRHYGEEHAQTGWLEKLKHFERLYDIHDEGFYE